MATKLERENLEAHVDLCAERYESMEKRLEQMDQQFEKIDKRFDSIDAKVDLLKETMLKGNSAVTKALIGTAGTIIVALITTVGIILTR